MNQQSKRIGLFGGTFNPIHFGHINLAMELKEKKNLSEVWFILSHQSPLRLQEESPAGVQHRLKMLDLALAEIPDFHVCDIEIKRPAPSYTIDTLREIIPSFPNDTFFLLLGEDSLIHFREWKEHSEIISLASLLIGSRPSSHLLKLLPALGLDKNVVLAIQEGLVSTRQMEISGTDIRNRIKKRMYSKHLAPMKVLDYIYENQLYFTPHGVFTK